MFLDHCMIVYMIIFLYVFLISFILSHYEFIAEEWRVVFARGLQLRARRGGYLSGVDTYQPGFARCCEL